MRRPGKLLTERLIRDRLSTGLGELIELAFKAIAGLIWLTAYVFIHALRLLGIVLARVANVTVGLVQQSQARKRSPDGRYWWNGRAWIPMRPLAQWAIPVSVLASVVLIAGVCMAAMQSPQPTYNTQVSVATSVSSPSTDPEADLSATPPATASTLPVAIKTTCGDPHAHVYSPDRLQLLAPCVTVTGQVMAIRTEKDGDLHVLLQLDPGQNKYINAENVSAESGDLVTEPVCVDTPTQTDAIPACAGYHNPLPIPALGSHVAATGAWVLDLDHGWMELHPVFAYSAAESAPPAIDATPSTAPPPAPSRAPVNLCGAPANPWSYTFCSGHLITSPDPGFCSYFPCISSFWNGTGYVVQCADGTFSKSGGHTGVCSYHGGYRRNLYAP